MALSPQQVPGIRVILERASRRGTEIRVFAALPMLSTGISCGKVLSGAAPSVRIREQIWRILFIGEC